MAPIAFRGNFFHTPVYGQVQCLQDKVLVIQDGVIARVADGCDEEAVAREFGLDGVRRLQVNLDVPCAKQPKLKPPARRCSYLLTSAAMII